MPAVSKKQQRFMGMVHALNKGEIKPSDVSKDVQDVAKDMKKKDAKDFASTKHKGLPVKKEVLNKLKEMIRQELSEYTYGTGDVVKDVNPSCPHYGAMGKVKSVNPRSVIFIVKNKGKNFKPGMELEKSHDQMKKMNEVTTRTDKSIGTKNYKGVGWFWPSALWKHYLRDTSDKGRKEVHDAWLKAGFEVKKDNRGIPGFDIKPSQKNKAMKIVDAIEKRIPIKESVNESKKEKDQIIKYLQGLGFDERTAKNGVAKSYDYISKAYRNTGTRYKGDLIANILNKKESVNEMSAKTKKIISKLGKKEKEMFIDMVDMLGFDQVMADYKRDKKAFKQALKDMSENIIKEEGNEVQTGKDYTKLWLQAINLIIKQANGLKGALAKHPIKRDINKLKAVEKLFKKFIKPAIEKEGATNRHYAPDITRLNKYLSDGKFKAAIQYVLRDTLKQGNFRQNSWYYLDDKQTSLIKKMDKVLYDIENKMDKANLENVNESMSPSQLKKMRDDFEKTGELPPHLKKFVKDVKILKKKHKVKNIVVPGLEWMSDMKESVNEASVSQVRSTISRVKKQLMKKWAKKGGYENFGQKELRNLKSKFKENPYGSPEERQISQMLSSFDNWAMNYSGDMRESVNEDGHTDVASSKRKVMIMVDDSNKLLNKLNGMNKEDSLPSWWSDKITLSQSYLSKATDFLLNPVESVNEAMSKSQASELLKQLGGNKFISMTGAKNLTFSGLGLVMQIGKNSKGVTHVRFKLSSKDLYDIDFLSIRGSNVKTKSKEKGVYVDQLGKVFKKNTGLKTGLKESVNESKEPEVITQLRDIVKRQTNKKIKDPKTKKTMRVDMFTANAITQVYDAVKKTSHKSKFESLPLDKMAQLSFKMMK